LEIHDIKKVCAGSFSAALTSNNQLIIWGQGEFGTFKTPQKVCIDQVNFVDVCVSRSPAEAYLVALDVTGKLFTWGTNSFG